MVKRVPTLTYNLIRVASSCRQCLILGHNHVAMVISMATCRYSDRGPQIAICSSVWKLAETSLLKTDQIDNVLVNKPLC